VHAGLLRCVLLALLHHGHAVGLLLLLLVGVLLPAVLLELLLGDHGLLSSVRTSLGLVILIGVGIELLLLVGLLLLLLLEALMSAATTAAATHAAAICFESEGRREKKRRSARGERSETERNPVENKNSRPPAYG
jgi:hypothetical protein